MSQSLVDAFCAAFAAVSGIPHVVESEAAAAEVIAAIVREAGAPRVALALLSPNLESAAADALAAAGVEVLRPPYPPGEAVALLDKTPIGVTAAAFAIAQTGTLAELVRDDSHRLVSALPRTHIGVVYARDIVDTLRGSAQRLREVLAEGHPNVAVSFISGPSRTGDIEMILTLGVHGPEIAHAVIIAEPENA